VKAKLLAGAGVILLAGAFAVVPAGGDAGTDLSVYAGQAIASPLGLITRVPAESAGGVIYAESDLELGKARSLAAGVTPGNLAEAFLATTLAGYVNPSMVTAQYPRSNVFPSDATAPLTLNGGGANVAHFHAVADATPSTTADASGGLGQIPNVLRIGGGTSHTHSEVRADGTVITTAVSTLQDVRIGAQLASLLNIGTMTSTAEVQVPLGAKPKASVTVQMSGVLLGGVPVTITQDGINLAGSVPLPATAVAVLNQSLAQLAAQGIRLQAVPVTKTATDTDATASGAALEIGYRVPTQVQLPTDIGKDETVLLGQVSAQATGRKRQPLSLGEIPALTPQTPNLASGAVSSDLSLAPAASPVAAAPGALSSSPASAAPGAAPFRLQRRVRNTAAAKVLAGYGIIILAALMAIAAYAVSSRTRLTE
jgi:hypothetical protein